MASDPASTAAKVRARRIARTLNQMFEALDLYQRACTLAYALDVDDDNDHADDFGAMAHRAVHDHWDSIGNHLAVLAEKWPGIKVTIAARCSLKGGENA